MILTNDKPNPTLHLDEKTNVEEPFLDQLAGLGWDVIRLQQVQTPEQSLRASFDQVVLLPKLEDALRRINPFLSDNQVAEVVRRSPCTPKNNLNFDWRIINALLKQGDIQKDKPMSEAEETGKFTPHAATLWRRVPAWAQAKLLANVYCAHCGAMVTITNYSGRIVEGDLLLTGLCARCGGVVARLIESE